MITLEQCKKILNKGERKHSEEEIRLIREYLYFIGQIESAGISITLTASSNMIFLSTGYKYGVYDQARARIHRKGQVNKCTYYHLIATNTIDEKIMKALRKKEALAESVIDDYKKEGRK